MKRRNDLFEIRRRQWERDYRAAATFESGMPVAEDDTRLVAPITEDVEASLEDTQPHRLVPVQRQRRKRP